MSVTKSQGKKTSRVKEFPNQNKSWSTDEDLQLLDLYKTKSYEEIGKIIGRTPSSCAGRIYSLNNNTAKNRADSVGNTGKVWTWEDDQLLLELDHKGRTHASIARQIKRTEISVSGRLQSLKRMGKKYNPSAEKPASLVPIEEYKAVNPDFGPRGKLTSRKKRQSFTDEQKMQVVNDYINGNQTLRELGKKYNVNFQVISNWHRAYLKKGVSAPTEDKKVDNFKETPLVDSKTDVIVEKQSDLQKIIDQFKGVKGTTILVIHQS